MKSNTDLFDLLTRERGQVCELCHVRPATEMHHCLYHRRRGAPCLDDGPNIELLCHQCHQDGAVNSWAHRVAFWRRQTERYDMDAWHEALPIKKKERFV